MNTHSVRVAIAALMTPFLLLAACNDGDPRVEITGQGGPDDTPAEVEFDPATSTVTVAFRDSSVPPEYHRSWQLELDQGTASLTVDSYGDVVATDSATMPADAWEAFLSALPADLDRWGTPESDEVSCAGGTGTSITVDGGAGADDGSASLVLDNCFGDQEAISAELLALVEPFTDLVDLDEHTATD